MMDFGEVSTRSLYTFSSFDQISSSINLYNTLYHLSGIPNNHCTKYCRTLSQIISNFSMFLERSILAVE